MRALSRITALMLLVLAAMLLPVGCSTSTPQGPTTAPSETLQEAELDAAIATASQAVSQASNYIVGLKQSMDDPPPSDDLEMATSTLNLAATQTGATQRTTAQSALDQLNAGIEKTTAAAGAAPQDTATQDQYQQLISTLEVGRDALAAALE
jgi:hypothetical protein